MKKFQISTRKILFSLLLIISLVFIGNITLIFSLRENNAFAYSYFNENSLTLSNNTFRSYGSSKEKGLPYSLSGYNWTIKNDANVLAGVINVDEDTFKENNNFMLSSNPGISQYLSGNDKNILMFKSTGNNAGKASATSESVSLSKASFYEISLWALTANGAVGSISATFGDSVSQFTAVSANTWTKYSFLVATSEFSTASFSITLNFNSNVASKGEVFYDEITINEISNADFYETASTSTLNIVDLNSKYSGSQIESLQLNNFNFENGLDENWVKSSISGGVKSSINVYDSSIIYSTLNNLFDVTDENIAKTNVANNTKSLLMINEDSTTSSLSTSEDNYFVIEQHKVYRLSFLIKTGNISGDGLSFTLTPIYDDTVDEDAKIEAVTLSNQVSSNGLNSYNGFTRVYMYIKGDVRQDQKVSLKISLGACSGWAIVDDITLISINSSDCDTSSLLDFTSNTSDTTTILNGDFNFANITDTNSNYPLSPSNWSYSDSTTSSQSGIIRINPTDFIVDSANYGYPTNPGVNTAYHGNNYDKATNDYQNVLMIRNVSSYDTYFTSSKISLSANSSSTQKIVRLSIGVKTVNGSTAFINLVDSNGNVLTTIQNIDTNNEWKTYSVYIKNGISAISCSLQLGVNGYSNSSYTDNFAFFDCAEYDDSQTPDISTMTKNGCAYVDLYENRFYNSSTNFTNYEKLDDSSSFQVVNSSDELLRTYDDLKSQNILKLINSSKTYQTIITDYTYSLKANSYYEISVYIKTNFSLDQNGEKYGAFFELVSIDDNGDVVKTEKNEDRNYFSNIIVSTTKNNGWEKYSMYILAKEDVDVKILLGIGTSENTTKGTIYFDNLKVTDIDETTYAEKKSSYNTIVSDKIEIPETDDESSSTTTSPTDVNVWLLVSSILLVVALIFAIAGFSIRRLPKKKKENKVMSSSYSKTTLTVDKNSIKRELKEQREQNIAQLDEEIKNLENEYEVLKNEYEQQKTNDEVLNQPLYVEFTKKSNKLLSQIEYLKSAKTYITDTSTILSQERKEINRKKNELIDHSKKLNDNNDKKHK